MTKRGIEQRKRRDLTPENGRLIDRFGFEPEVTAKVARFMLPDANGEPTRPCRIYEIPVSYHGRTYREGKHIGWKDGFQALYCIVRYAFKD